MRILKTIVLTSMLAASFSTNATASNMSGAEIKDKINGKRVLLSTRWGIEFPLIYSKSGRVTGDGTGTGLGKFFAPKETGKWWIRNNQMCQKFPTWYKGRTFCFSLEDKGGNQFIWKRDDGASGKARVG